MKQKISRRSFIAKSTRLGLSALAVGSLIQPVWKGVSGRAWGAEKTDITVVKGDNYFNDAEKAVQLLGGMEKFVPKNSKVGVLVNSSFEKPGTYVNPAIVLAAVKMCYAAGAKEIILLKSATQKYWDRNVLSKQYADEIKSLKSVASSFTKAAVRQGKKLKEVGIKKELLDCDVFINIPITKNHSGTNFTGTMKNMMGATSRETNSFIHFGSGAKKPYDDVEFLSQCIADLNLIRRPNLCIVDATEFITTNGPFGPGKIIKPRQVIAGADGIAVDSYCSTLLGLNGSDVIMIKKGHEQGLGELNVKNLSIKKATI